MVAAILGKIAATLLDIREERGGEVEDGIVAIQSVNFSSIKVESI